MPAFTVMTWNVENLFAPGADAGSGKSLAKSQYEAKLDFLAARIREVAPTVVALQEVGGEQPLEDLSARVAYPHKRAAAPDSRGIRVAFLSKLPVTATGMIRTFPAGELSTVPSWEGQPPAAAMGRPALWIDVKPDGAQSVRLVTLHLKSKLITYPGNGGRPRFSPRDENERARGVGLALVRRTAEAVAVRTALDDFLAEVPETQRPIVVAGDFNDVARAATTELFLGPADADASRKDAGDAWRLFDLTDSIPLQGDETKDKRFLPGDESFSRVTRGRHEMLDHILASRNLIGTAEEVRDRRFRVKEVRSRVDSIVDQGLPGDAPRIGEERPDHAPVYAAFEW